MLTRDSRAIELVQLISAAVRANGWCLELYKDDPAFFPDVIKLLREDCQRNWIDDLANILQKAVEL